MNCAGLLVVPIATKCTIKNILGKTGKNYSKRTYTFIVSQKLQTKFIKAALSMYIKED